MCGAVRCLLRSRAGPAAVWSARQGQVKGRVDGTVWGHRAVLLITDHYHGSMEDFCVLLSRACFILRFLVAFNIKFRSLFLRFWTKHEGFKSGCHAL